MGLTVFMAALLGLLTPFLMVAQPRVTLGVRVARILHPSTPRPVKIAYLLGAGVSVTSILAVSLVARYVLSLLWEYRMIQASWSEVMKIMEVVLSALTAATILVAAQLVVEAPALMTLGELYRILTLRTLSYFPYAMLLAIKPPTGNTISYVITDVVILQDIMSLGFFVASLITLLISAIPAKLNNRVLLKALAIIVASRLALTLTYSVIISHTLRAD